MRIRSTIIAFAGAIVLTASICGQVPNLGLSMAKVMTSEELRETGVGSLSPSQRVALDAWLNRYTERVIQVVQGAKSKSTTTAQSSCDPVVETTIDGDFNGWEGETIFKLLNGQIWQQVGEEYMYSYAYMPQVTIYPTSDGCVMKVQDVDDTILVKRIK